MAATLDYVPAPHGASTYIMSMVITTSGMFKSLWSEQDFLFKFFYI